MIHTVRLGRLDHLDVDLRSGDIDHRRTDDLTLDVLELFAKRGIKFASDDVRSTAIPEDKLEERLRLVRVSPATEEATEETTEAVMLEEGDQLPE